MLLSNFIVYKNVHIRHDLMFLRLFLKQKQKKKWERNMKKGNMKEGIYKSYELKKIGCGFTNLHERKKTNYKYRYVHTLLAYS